MMEGDPLLKRSSLVWLLLFLTGNVERLAAQGLPIEADWVIRGGTVIDGSGPGRGTDVAIRGDRIVAVGEFAADPEAKVIDATGWVVAPGFIDLHTHSDEAILGAETRPNRNYLTQGVTTIVTGNCGSGPLDVGHATRRDRQARGGHERHPPDPARGGPQAVMGNVDRSADSAASWSR